MRVPRSWRGWFGPVVLGGLFLLLIFGFFWPVFAGGHPTAPNVACLSHLKQLGTGTAIYEADFDDALPVATFAGRPSAVGWGARLLPYVKDESLFACPLDKGKEGEKRLSYALNANAAAIPKITAATDPARSVLLFETAGTPPARGGTFLATLGRSPAGDGGAGGLLDSADPAVPPTAGYATGALANSGLPAEPPGRHKGKATYTFLDGHARHLAPQDVSAGANAGARSDAERISGCARSDLPGTPRPCAEGAARKGRAATFSLR